jgi:iron complex transport system substrate-binding protein
MGNRSGCWSLAVWLLTASLGAAVAGLSHEVRVVDDLGRTVWLPQPARRIVSLSPHITELVFAVGAGGRLVGVSEHSDYPAEARRLPRVGGGGGLDLEAILALEPDLIIAWGSGNPSEQLTALMGLSVPLFVSEPRRLEDIATNLERIGRLAGDAPAGDRAARDFRRQVANLRARYGGGPPVRVFYQIWDPPLMTVTSHHLIGDVIRLCGGRTLFPELGGLAVAVDREAVLARDPELIVAGVSEDGQGETALAAWQRWPSLSAVAQGRLITVSADRMHRQTPRLLEAAEVLCAAVAAARPQSDSDSEASR